MVLDEGLLFRTNESAFVETKRKLLDECDVWGIVSLPGGVGAGDTAWLFGDAGAGLPTADDWGEAIGTIGYEVVTRLGARVPRNYHGSVER